VVRRFEGDIVGRGKRKRAVLPRGEYEKRARSFGSSTKWAEGEEKVRYCPEASMKRERSALEAVQNGQREKKECCPAHERV